MDLVCHGLDGVMGGNPLFMDVTLISSLHGSGTSMPFNASVDGAANNRAENRKRIVDYPDVHVSDQATLLSLGTETYGRWSNHCLTLIRQLARLKSRHMPDYLKNSVEQASYSRWWNILSVTVQQIIGDSILRLNGSDLFQGNDIIRQIPIDEFLDRCT